MKVPFCNLELMHSEIELELKNAFDKVLKSNNFIRGRECQLFEEEFAQYCETKYCVGVANGLEALYLILKALDIKDGDEVILPANTYIAIKIVSEAEKTIRVLMLKAQRAKDDDKAPFMEKAQEIFERTLSAVNKNVVNDHILCLLLKELDKKKDSKVSRFRHLLFACLVYEDGKRLLSKVKGARDYIYPELVFWNDDPGETWNLITENILGFLHVIIDNSQNTEQLEEKFYPK